jgi:hydroxymethylglutaryl-CoA reductase (NADPH)
MINLYDVPLFMADDAEPGDSMKGEKSSRDPEKDGVMYTRLKNGSCKLYELEKELSPLDAIRVRRVFIEQETGTTLENIGIFSLDIERVVKRNCENMIGTVQVPVGVAGPLLVDGEYAQGSYYLPLATTEGALVASVNRGCSAITRAGGAQVRILHDGMTRAPVFAADTIVHAKQVADWVATHRDDLRAVAESTTSHGKMTDVVTYIAGTSVFVRIEFDTKDAMGMNMVTIASAKVAELIAEHTGARLIALSGNMCTDKKPAAINGIMGRGRSVVAGIALSHELIGQILKTDARSLFEVNYRKNLVGSARAGSMGFNAHAANVVAAMFIACGQDAAHAIDGSTCITTVDLTDSGVYISVTLPSLPVGTVGGGTGLETQQECLKILGVAGSGNPPGTNARKLGEIIGAGVLAGELSLLGALAAQHLARAHQQLGRG